MLKLKWKSAVVSLYLLLFCLHQLWTTDSAPALWFFHFSRFLWFSVSECRQLSNTEPVMHGQIQSPQYPRPYPPHLQKQWDLWVPRGYQIQLSLTHLDIKASADCSQDSLTVRALIRSEFKQYFKQDTKHFILQFSILVYSFIQFDWKLIWITTLV